MAPLDAENITNDAFTEVLSRYSGVIPSKLEDLELYRMDTLPELLQKRRESKNGSWMEKSELVKLVEWKLKHGTFRPKLLSLVLSNPADEIKSLTQAVFADYSSSKAPDRPSLVARLAKLKGIGPATASLILAAYDPDGAIFFGDEVFRWLSWGEPQKGASGWGRKIAYNASEYRTLDRLASALTARLGVAAVDVEKVGYVLGKESADVDAGAKMSLTATKAPERSKRKSEAADSTEAKPKRSKRSR